MTSQAFGPEWVEINREQVRAGDRMEWTDALGRWHAGSVSNLAYLCVRETRVSFIWSDGRNVHAWRRTPQLPTEEGAVFRAHIPDENRTAVVVVQHGEYIATGATCIYFAEDFDMSTFEPLTGATS